MEEVYSILSEKNLPYKILMQQPGSSQEDVYKRQINSLVTMVSGLFRKERLLAVIKDFVYFPDSSDKDLKIVCRYPQYFAPRNSTRSSQLSPLLRL